MNIEEVVKAFNNNLNINLDELKAIKVDEKNYSINRTSNSFRFKLKSKNSFASITIECNDKLNIINSQNGKDKLSNGLLTILYNSFSSLMIDKQNNHYIENNSEDENKKVEEFTLKKEGKANNISRIFLIVNDKDDFRQLKVILPNNDSSFEYKLSSNQSGTKNKWNILSNNKSFELVIDKNSAKLDNKYNTDFIIVETNDRYLFYSYK